MRKQSQGVPFSSGRKEPKKDFNASQVKQKLDEWRHRQDRARDRDQDHASKKKD